MPFKYQAWKAAKDVQRMWLQLNLCAARRACASAHAPNLVSSCPSCPPAADGDLRQVPPQVRQHDSAGSCCQACRVLHRDQEGGVRGQGNTWVHPTQQQQLGGGEATASQAAGGCGGCGRVSIARERPWPHLWAALRAASLYAACGLGTVLPAGQPALPWGWAAAPCALINWGLGIHALRLNPTGG